MFRIDKRLTPAVGAFAMLALLLAACGNGGEEQNSSDAEGIGDMDADFLTIASGSSSGVYYQIGATMADVLASELGSDTSSQPTGGSVENINLLSDNNAELAIVSSDAIAQSMEGLGPFEDDARDDLMGIMTMYPNTFHLVAQSSSGIESIEDLKGANVAVGDIGSGVELNTRAVLDAYEMSYDDINEDYLSYAEAADQIANGHIDAMFISTGVPNPAATELGTQTSIHTVPIDGAGREAVLEQYDYFHEATVPAEAYGDDGDVETIGVVNHLLVTPELSEEAVYDITAALFANIERIQNSHNEASSITLDTALDDLSVPLHPGAQKYFDEQDIEENIED